MPRVERAPTRTRPVLLILGAFPKPGTAIGVGGGVLTSCKALLDAGLGDWFELKLIDTTQRTQLPQSAPVRMMWAVPRMLKFFGALLRAPRPDGTLIFLSVGFSFVEKSLLALGAKMLGVKVAIAPRGGPIRDEVAASRIMYRIVQTTVRRVDHVICQGESWVEFFSQFLEPGTANRGKLIAIMNWTASERALALGAARIGRLEAQAPKPALHFLFFGWIIPEKGVAELIEGFALAHARVPQIRLKIAGAGTFEAEARSLAASHALGDAIEFVGWVSGDAKYAALESADCLCLPSWSEGMPNAVIEAMSAALPCVVTPVGAVGDAAPHESTSLHVPLRDPRAIASAFERLATDGALCVRLSIAAHERAKQRFTAPNALQAIGRMFGATPPA